MVNIFNDKWCHAMEIVADMGRYCHMGVFMTKDEGMEGTSLSQKWLTSA